MAAMKPSDPTPSLGSDFLNPSAFAEEAPSHTRVEHGTQFWQQSRAETPHQKTESVPPPVPQIPTVPGYEILRELGRGGMGVVYLARHQGLQRLVALKMILGGGHASPEDLARFRSEVQAVARVQHPHIVQIYEVGECQGLPYCALEYVPGSSLDQRIKGQPQNPTDAAQIVALLADAMQTAHEAGIVHRDLKPANILLALNRAPQARAESLSMRAGDEAACSDDNGAAQTFEDGSARAGGARLNDYMPKITDFGLAKRLDMEGQTKTGDLLGTPSYMAPEQASGGRMGAVGPAADVYALGAILYELLTGRPPFQGLSPIETVLQVMMAEVVPPRQLQPSVPKDLETICLKCLQKESGKRYGSAAALAEDLRRFTAGQPILARPIGMVGRTWRWCRRNPMVAGLTAAVFLLLVTAVVGLSIGLATVTQLNAQLDWKNSELDKKNGDLEAAHRLEQMAREKAEANYSLACDAAEQFLSRTTEHTKLKEEDFHDLRTALLKAALPLFNKLAEGEPTDPRQQEARGRALQRLAFLRQELGEKEKACADYAAAREIFAGLRQTYPKNLEYPHQEAVILDQWATTLVFLGRWQEAEESYRQALKVRQELLPRLWDKNALQSVMVNNHINYGLMLTQRQRYAEAETQCQAARVLLEEMLRRKPQDRLLRRQMAKLTGVLGDVSLNLAKFTEAEKQLSQTLAVRRTLVQEDPKDPGLRQDLSNAHNNLGNFYRITRHMPEAEREYQASLQVSAKLVQDFPQVPRYRQEQAGALHNLAVIRLNTNNFSGAEEASHQCGALLEPLAQKYPQQPSYRADLGKQCQMLGTLAHKQNRHQEAEKHLRQALAWLRPLVKEYPTVGDYKQTLSYGCSHLGAVLEKLNRDEEAMAICREGLELRRQLVEDFPHVLQYAVDLGSGHNSLALVLGRNNFHEEAVAEYAKAMTVLEPLVKKNPRHGPARNALRTALAGSGVFREKLGRYTEAAQDYTKALALDQTPNAIQDELRVRRALMWSRSGKYAEAAQEIDALASKPHTAENSPYALACASALIVAGVRAESLQEHHAVLALKFLRLAQERGYFRKPKNVEELAKEEAFEALRQRPDFQKFMGEVAPQ
jgi:serine/threonine protein kinase/tetratricopeptide (TPR) repeat protein